MTKEDLQKARDEGKTIQFNCAGDWMDWDNPDFSAEPEDYRIKPEVKQLEELKAQEGLPDAIITEILKTKDINKAYKILMQSAVLFYHLNGQNTWKTEADYFRDFPFTVHYLDGGTVAGELLEKYATEKGIW